MEMEMTRREREGKREGIRGYSRGISAWKYGLMKVLKSLNKMNTECQMAYRDGK